MTALQIGRAEKDGLSFVGGVTVQRDAQYAFGRLNRKDAKNPAIVSDRADMDFGRHEAAGSKAAADAHRISLGEIELDLGRIYQDLKKRLNRLHALHRLVESG